MHAGVPKCVASDSVYQHFWSTTGSVFKQENTSRPAAQEAVDDIMETDAVKDRVGQKSGPGILLRAVRKISYE